MEQDTVFGVRAVTVILAFVGSMLSLSYVKEMTRLQMAVAVVTGHISAVYVTLILRYYDKVPEPLEAAAGFFCGLAMMRVVPAIIDTVIENIKRFKFPWAKD